MTVLRGDPLPIPYLRPITWRTVVFLILPLYTLLVAWTAYSFGHVHSLNEYGGVRPGQAAAWRDGESSRVILWGNNDETIARVRRAIIYERVTEAWIDKEVAERTQRTLRETWMP